MCGLLGWALVSIADERILSYASDIRINADGSMTVAETIRVRAEGDSIRRGIFRDYPTDYRDRFGNRYRVDFQILSVQRDGIPEPYSTEGRSNGTRVYIGRQDVLLQPDEYEYRLSYSTNHQIGFFQDHDELYWNVTGNGWGFPIDAASARVELPARVGTATLTMAGYTGVQGSSESDVNTEIESESSARISSSRPLGVREGLTLVLSFPKGIVEEPTTVDRASRLLSENRVLLIALLGFTAMLVYMISIWKRYGCDPEPGTTFPHYEAPSDISPASARHVTRMRYDGTAFTAAVINLAVKGHLNIDESGDEYTLAAVSGSNTPLSTGEHAIVSTLFASEKAVVLDNENHALLQRTMNAHKKSLKRENFRTYYVTNSTYLFPALAIVAVTVLGTLIGGRITPAAIAVLVLSAICLPVFGYLLKAPTSIGRRLIDKIEGFRLYLDVAEKDELELKNPPEKTPELFEAFLPYALALGVEQSWGREIR
jgi:hypothetical protein